MMPLHRSTALPRIKVSPPTPPSPPGLPVKHAQYYMPQGNVVLQVENSLFCLDLAVLHKHSTVLSTIVRPLGTRSLDLIVMLNDVLEVDFVSLLGVLYRTDDEPPKEKSVQEWLSILKLATRFQMDSIRTLATASIHMFPINPIRKIAIWEEYALDPALLTSSYVELCERQLPLTLAMTITIGLRMFTKVAAARDLYRQRVGYECCTKYSKKERAEIAQEVVKVVFGPPKQRRLPAL